MRQLHCPSALTGHLAARQRTDMPSKNDFPQPAYPAHKQDMKLFISEHRGAFGTFHPGHPSGDHDI